MWRRSFSDGALPVEGWLSTKTLLCRGSRPADGPTLDRGWSAVSTAMPRAALGKDFLCRGPDKKPSAKPGTLGKAWVSCSERGAGYSDHFGPRQRKAFSPGFKVEPGLNARTKASLSTSERPEFNSVILKKCSFTHTIYGSYQQQTCQVSLLPKH
jgi:hypothetical protein